MKFTEQEIFATWRGGRWTDIVTDGLGGSSSELWREAMRMSRRESGRDGKMGNPADSGGNGDEEHTWHGRMEPWSIADEQARSRPGGWTLEAVMGRLTGAEE